MGGPIKNKGKYGLDSYSGHKFVARFEKESDLKVEFTKSSNAEQVSITYDKEAKTLSAESATQFAHVQANPNREAARKRKEAKQWDKWPKQVNSSLNVVDTVNEATVICQSYRGDEFSNCMASNIAEDIIKLSDTKTQLIKFRDAMSSRLRNYTCADDTLSTSQPLFSYYTSLKDKEDVKVDVLWNKSHSKIWTVQDNFISDEECAVLMKHGKPLLRRATVADEDGSSKVSESRKAQQAGYHGHVSHPTTDPLANLYKRVFEMTNHHLGWNLDTPGQEDFTIIQYNPSDQYTPHCDGSCDNSPHIDTGRVATCVLYCHVPEEGGATTFTKSNLLVRPKKGAATFFSYKGEDGRMDDGYTEHSGCPVIRGEKWITTVWMREGVSDSKPWSQYDPNGVKMIM